MTLRECTQLLAVLRANYPNSYKGLSEKDSAEMAKLWQELLADDSYADAMIAVKAILMSDPSDFAPNVGKIKRQIVNTRHERTGNVMTAAEAWALVKNALSRSIYYSESEFEKLPSLCQRIVGSPSQLRAWAIDDASATDTVIASNFMKSYNVIAKREQERELLPIDLKRAMGLLEG